MSNSHPMSPLPYLHHMPIVSTQCCHNLLYMPSVMRWRHSIIERWDSSNDIEVWNCLLVTLSVAWMISNCLISFKCFNMSSTVEQCPDITASINGVDWYYCDGKGSYFTMQEQLTRWCLLDNDARYLIRIWTISFKPRLQAIISALEPS